MPSILFCSSKSFTGSLSVELIISWKVSGENTTLKKTSPNFCMKILIKAIPNPTFNACHKLKKPPLLDFKSLIFNKKTGRYHNLADGNKMVKMADAIKIIEKYYADVDMNLNKSIDNYVTKGDDAKYLSAEAVESFADAIEAITMNLIEWANEKEINDPEMLEKKAA